MELTGCANHSEHERPVYLLFASGFCYIYVLIDLALWRHDNDTISELLTRLVTGGSPSQKSVIQSFYIFFIFSMEKLAI